VVEVGVRDHEPLDRAGVLLGGRTEISRRRRRVPAVDDDRAAPRRPEVGEAGVADGGAGVVRDGRPDAVDDLLEAVVVGRQSTASRRERTYCSSACGPSSATSSAREPTTIPSASAAAAAACAGVEIPKPA
jgi:hypothetical protein